MSFPPLAMAEWGFAGEFGLEPTTYGAGRAPQLNRGLGRLW
jgi:hypothetical protein